MSDDNRQSFFNKARIDKFVMVLNLPKGLKGINEKFHRSNNTISLDALQFSVFGSIIPEIIVPAAETKFSGSNIYVSTHARPPFPPISVSFTIDNQFNNYWTIYQWLNLLRDEREGVYGIVNAKQLVDKAEVLKDYSTTLTVVAKDEFNGDVIKFDYHHAFPTKLGGINWNYQESKEIVSSFEFVFSNITCSLI